MKEDGLWLEEKRFFAYLIYIFKIKLLHVKY